MRAVYQELHRWAGLPFVWGETDCMLVLADWILRVRGVDPAAHVRGMYHDAGTCQRETGFLRDPVVAVDGCLATIGGLPKVSDPAEGDIAVLTLSVGPGGRVTTCGGLWLGQAWACKGPTGATTIAPREVLEVMAVWRVCDAA
jgi:hypothetical protein